MLQQAGSNPHGDHRGQKTSAGAATKEGPDCDSEWKNFYAYPMGSITLFTLGHRSPSIEPISSWQLATSIQIAELNVESGNRHGIRVNEIRWVWSAGAGDEQFKKIVPATDSGKHNAGAHKDPHAKSRPICLRVPAKWGTAIGAFDSTAGRSALKKLAGLLPPVKSLDHPAHLADSLCPSFATPERMDQSP